MKWNKYRQYERQHPWLRKFVGPVASSALKSGATQKEKNSFFKGWVEEKLNFVVFRPYESLFSESHEKHHSAHVSNSEFLTVMGNNIHYPFWSSEAYYALYHLEGFNKPFSCSYRIHDVPTEENMKDFLSLEESMKRFRAADSRVEFDAVAFVVWRARAMSGIMTQGLNVWLLP